MRADDDFFNLHAHDFVRVAVGVPVARVADPPFNAAQTLALMQRAVERRAVVALFPEPGLSAYSCEDLFHQRALLDACHDALASLLDGSRGRPVVAVVGLPVQGRRSPLQLRRGDPRRATAGAGAEDLPAELPRILRAAALRLG